VDEQGVVQSRDNTPAFGFSILQNLKRYLCVDHKITRGRTSHIQTSKTAAATSYAVSPHLLRIKGSAFCFVNK
jgi:hypothetical protein